MNSKLSKPSVLVGLCCIGILTAGYMPDDFPLQFVESHGEWSETRDCDIVTRLPNDGKHVYYLNRDTIHLLKRERDSGTLEVVREIYDDALSGDQRGSCFSNDGTTLFTSATVYQACDVVRAYQHDSETGDLTHLRANRKRILPQPELTHIGGIVCSHDGKQIKQHLFCKLFLTSFSSGSVS